MFEWMRRRPDEAARRDAEDAERLRKRNEDGEASSIPDPLAFVTVIQSSSHLVRAKSLVSFALGAAAPFADARLVRTEVVEQERHFQQVALKHDRVLVVPSHEALNRSSSAVKQADAEQMDGEFVLTIVRIVRSKVLH